MLPKIPQRDNGDLHFIIISHFLNQGHYSERIELGDKEQKNPAAPW